MNAQGVPDSNPYESPRAKGKSRRINLPKFLLPVRIILAFALAAGFGAGVWALSPVIFGKEEPWDASLPLYYVSLLIGGFGCAMICPRWFWVSALGVYLGQLTYCLVTTSQNPAAAVVLLVALAFFGVPPTMAGAIGAFTASLIWKASRRGDEP